ncbi:MAG: hypothetical protein AAFV29_01510, partial [Myxococcota bacterium]
LEEGRARFIQGPQAELEPGALILEWFLQAEDFKRPDGTTLTEEELQASVSIRFDDQPSVEGFGGCNQCSAPTRAPPYTASPGDSCRLPANAQTTVRRLAGDAIQTIEQSTLSSEEQDALTALTNRIRVDWAGPCTCPAGQTFEKIEPFTFVPIAPTSALNAFWASAIRPDGVVVSLSSEFVHVFDRAGVEHRSPAFSDFTIDGLHPLSDGQFAAWGIDDTRPLFESTRVFLIDVSDPSRPDVRQATITGWPEHVTFRLRRWNMQSDGTTRLIGSRIPAFSGSVTAAAVADCEPSDDTLRCQPLQTLACRDSDSAISTVSTPDTTYVVTHRTIQSADACVDLRRGIEEVTTSSGLQLTDFRDIQKSVQDDDWVYMCAKFARASIIYAAQRSQLETPAQWRVLPIGVSCSDQDDFVKVDGIQYFVSQTTAFRLADGAIQEQIGIDDFYALNPLSPVQSLRHASAGTWNLTGLGSGDLVLARREANGAWTRLRGATTPYPARDTPYGFGERDVFARQTTDIATSTFDLDLRSLATSQFASIYAIEVIGEEVLVGGTTDQGTGRIEVFTRTLTPVWSQTLGPVSPGIPPLAVTRLDDDTLIVGTTRGLWFGGADGFSRIDIDSEAPEGWTWDVRGGPGGVWAQSNAQLYFVQPGLTNGAAPRADRYIFDFIRGYDSPCPAQLAYVDNSMRTFVLAEPNASEASIERIFSERRERSLVANDDFNTNLRGRATDLVRRDNRALILTTQNLLLSANAEVVARVPFPTRRIQADERGFVYARGYQGRLAISSRAVFAPAR